MRTGAIVVSGLSALLMVGFPSWSASDPGDQYRLSPNNLPEPKTTFPEDINPRFVRAPQGFVPSVPPGFTISVFAAMPPRTHVRWLEVAPNGDVFLAERGPGRITLMRDGDRDGKAERVTIFATGFSQPHGLAFHEGGLYVGDVRAIWRLPYRDGDVVASAPATRVTQAADLRPVGSHSTREIAFDSQGKLYLAMGARGDLLDDDPPPDASIQEVTPAGEMVTFASGMRNPVGIAFYPGTDDLWATVNERDRLGSELPPDYLTHVSQDDFFGWPYAYIGRHPDPEFGVKKPDLVAKTKTPDVLFEAHSAPLGLAFYDGAQFPADYKNNAFVALHGSGPYNSPDGYKVVRVKFTNGKPVGGYEDFVTGFSDGKAPSPSVWGTPAGLAVTKDGALLIADDLGRTVWRVAYTGK